MSFFTPLRTGWRLSAGGLSGVREPSAFSLPGEEQLSAFSELLGLPEREEAHGVSFPLPGLLPEEAGTGAVLSRELRFGAVPDGQVLLHFPLLRGSGHILLDNSEIALFGDGPLALDLTAPSRRKRRQTLEICFDSPRPAGVPVLPFLTSAPGAHFLETRLIPTGGLVTGSAVIHADEPGTYAFSASAPGQDAPCQSLVLGKHEEKALSFSCPRSPDNLILLRLTRDSLTCDRLVLRCGTLPGGAGAFLPLSPEESLTAPAALCRDLKALGITAVGLESPAAPCLYSALAEAGIRVRQSGVPEESRAGLLRCPGLSFSGDPPLPGTPGACAWQLCGLASCPRVIPEGIPEDELQLRSCGIPVPEDAILPLKRLLLRLRTDGAALGRYSGPLAPAGALTDPDLRRVLEAAAQPHVAAAPLFGAWYAGSRFSCSLGIANAPAGSRGTACLRDAGTVLSEIRFSASERPVLEASLPDRAAILTLETALTLPDGTVLRGEPLPVPAGKASPLESFVSLYLNREENRAILG